MLSVAIIEDELEAQRVLVKLISNLYPAITVKGVADNYNDGLKLVQNSNPDILFIDINLGKKTGLELVQELKLLHQNLPIIIFTTAYDQYILDALRLESFDYLTKPIFKEDLSSCISRLRSKLNQTKFINVNTHNGILKVDLNKLIYLQADGAYTTLTCDDRDVVCSKSLGYFEKELANNSSFVRCHKSFIVNIMKVKTVQLSDSTIILSNSETISFSRSYKKEFLDKFKKSTVH